MLLSIVAGAGGRDGSMVAGSIGKHSARFSCEPKKKDKLVLAVVCVGGAVIFKICQSR